MYVKSVDVESVKLCFVLHSSVLLLEGEGSLIFSALLLGVWSVILCGGEESFLFSAVGISSLAGRIHPMHKAPFHFLVFTPGSP